MRWYKQELKINVGLVVDCFWGSTIFTAFYVVSNIVAKNWSIVFLAQKLKSLLNAKIAAQKVIIVMVNQSCFNSFRYKLQALMVKNLIDLFIAAKLLLLQSLGFAVGLLQLLQPKLYITNTGFLSFLIS